VSSPERSFIAGVHRYLPVELYHMKNHNAYTGGIADVWYSGTRGDLWIEYKFILLPARDDTVIDVCGGKQPVLSRLQQEWLARRAAEGRRVAVVVGCKAGGVWHSGPETWSLPMSTIEFRRHLCSRQELADMIVRVTMK
jgi:hypothetical protein